MCFANRSQTHRSSLPGQAVQGTPGAHCVCVAMGGYEEESKQDMGQQEGMSAARRYLLSAGMTLPESWLAPTSLPLSRPSTEMSGIATHITPRTDGNAIALVNNSSFLPSLE